MECTSLTLTVCTFPGCRIRGIFPLDQLFRCNDGRQDPMGGFWFSTMRKDAGAPAGKIYRLVEGSIIEVSSGLWIPNSLCFSPNGERYIFRYPPAATFSSSISTNGGFQSAVRLEIDFSLSTSILTVLSLTTGSMYIAMWGAGKVIKLSSNALEFQTEFCFPATNVSCPGIDLSSLSPVGLLPQS